MLAPEGPCHKASHLPLELDTAKSAHALFFTSLPLGPGCSAIPFCVIPFTGPTRLSLIPRLVPMLVVGICP
jgi:hypothetical protein